MTTGIRPYDLCQCPVCAAVGAAEWVAMPAVGALVVAVTTAVAATAVAARKILTTRKQHVCTAIGLAFAHFLA